MHGLSVFIDVMYRPRRREQNAGLRAPDLIRRWHKRNFSRLVLDGDRYVQGLMSGQTAFLSGKPPLDCSKDTGFVSDPLHAWMLSMPTSGVDDSRYELALAHLRAAHVVGVTERLEEVRPQLAGALGVPVGRLPSVTHENRKTFKRELRLNISDAARTLLSRTGYDHTLYREAASGKYGWRSRSPAHAGRDHPHRVQL